MKAIQLMFPYVKMLALRTSISPLHTTCHRNYKLEMWIYKLKLWSCGAVMFIMFKYSSISV